MKIALKRCIAAITACFVFFCMTGTALAAQEQNITVRVKTGEISLESGGKTLNTYTHQEKETPKKDDVEYGVIEEEEKTQEKKDEEEKIKLENPECIELTSSKEGEILVCFYDAQEERKCVSVGKQKELEIVGNATLFKLKPALGEDTTIRFSGEVKRAEIYSKNQVLIGGEIENIDAHSPVKIEVLSGAQAGRVKLRDPEAKIHAGSGASVRRVLTISNSSTSGEGIQEIAVQSKNQINEEERYTVYLDARKGQTLGELKSDLNNKLDNKLILAGKRAEREDISWEDADNYVLKEAGEHELYFTITEKSYIAGFVGPANILPGKAVIQVTE